jgi:hypothetical protein
MLLSRPALIPWDRRFLGFGEGTVTVYPPIAVLMVRRLQGLRLEFKGIDRWRWALWLEGYPVDIVRSVYDGLHQFQKLAKTAGDYLGRRQKQTEAADKVASVFREEVGKGRLRGKPLQPIFGRMRQQQARGVLLEWGVAIGAGVVPPASIYTPGSPAAKAFNKGTGAAKAPDPSLELERMSIPRLYEVVNMASPGDIEQARLDCSRLAGLVKLAASLDWSRVRDAINVTHRGGPATPIAPFERLIGLWENLDLRACIIPFLIFVRSRPGYRYKLDERFAGLEIELRALAEKAGSFDAKPREPAS